MTFLYPAFFWALFSLLIPIIIHLFDFQRAKKVAFTNVRFLRTVRSESRSKQRLKNLLVLLSRLLFLAFLVLAFTQPVIEAPNQDFGKGQQQVSLYLDNSYSMQTRSDEGTSLDNAVRMAEKLLDTYPASARFQLITNNFSGENQFFYPKSKIRDQLAEIRYSPNYRSLAEVQKRQQLSQQNAAEKRDIFWFSDFQESTAGDLTQLRADSTQAYNLIPIKNQASSNLFVDSVWLNAPFLRVGENYQLNVRIRNSGKEDANNVNLKLFIADVQAGTASLSIPDGGSQTSKITFNLAKRGLSRCRLQLQDQPVTFDNTHYFVLQAAPKIRVLHVYGEKSGYLNKVFSNDSLFKLQSFQAGNVDYSLFNEVDLVALEGIQAPEEGLVSAAAKFYRNGGSLALFPHQASKMGAYNQLASSFGIPTFGKRSDTAGNRHKMQPPAAANPFYEGVFEDLPSRVNLYAYPTLSISSRGQPLLKFKNGEPFLARFSNQSGKLYLCTSPLNPQFSKFPVHSFFVPTMYRMAMLSLEKDYRLAYSFQDDVAKIPVASPESEAVFSLKKGELELIPGQQISGNTLLLEIPQGDLDAGFYQVRHQGKPVQTIALNFGAKESKLTFYEPQTLSKKLSGLQNKTLFDIEDDAEFQTEFEEANIGTPLWKYCLMLALFFLLAEVLLLRFWK